MISINVLSILIIIKLCGFIYSSAILNGEINEKVFINSSHIISVQSGNVYNQSNSEKQDEDVATVLPEPNFTSDDAIDDSIKQSTTTNESTADSLRRNKLERTTSASRSNDSGRSEQEGVEAKLPDKNSLSPLEDEQVEIQEEISDEDDISFDPKDKADPIANADRNSELAAQDSDSVLGQDVNLNHETPKLGAGESHEFEGEEIEDGAKPIFRSRLRRPELFAQQPYVGDKVEYDESSGNFFMYFVVATMCLMLIYFLHQHRAKIVAMMTDRQGQDHRRSGSRSSEYRLLSRRFSAEFQSAA